MPERYQEEEIKEEPAKTYHEGDDPIESDLPYTQRIYDYLESADIDISEPTFYLYKYDHPVKGNQKTFIDKIFGEPPEQDDIGKQYGSGRYLMIMIIPARQGSKEPTTKTYRFRLHQHFDEYAFKRVGNAAPSQNVIQLPPGNSLNDTLSVLERLVTVFSPLIIPLIARPKDENVQQILSQTYESVNNLLKNSLQDNFRFIREIRENISGKEDEEMSTMVEEPTQQPSILNQILPILNEWLPKLLGGGIQGEAVSQVVKMTPQFRAVLDNKRELQSIINYLVKKEGVERTNKVLNALGIKQQVAASSPPLPTNINPAEPTKPTIEKRRAKR